MFDFNFSQHFLPSPSTRWFWLYTRKARSIAYGFERPGLFNRPNLFWPAMGVVAILILEGLATYISYDYGVVITAILATIFVDFVLAIVAHLPTRTIILEDNRRLFLEGEEREIAFRNARRGRRIQRMLYALILVSGFFKFAWFFLVYPAFDATSLLVLVCYVLGAVLHILATGYFVFTVIFLIKIRREEGRYVFSKGKQFSFDPQNPTKHLVANGSLPLVEAQVGHHRLAYDAKQHQHFLYTNGILTDTELNELIAKQTTPEQQYLVAREGLRIQVNML